MFIHDLLFRSIPTFPYTVFVHIDPLTIITDSGNLVTDAFLNTHRTPTQLPAHTGLDGTASFSWKSTSYLLYPLPWPPDPPHQILHFTAKASRTLHRRICVLPNLIRTFRYLLRKIRPSCKAPPLASLSALSLVMTIYLCCCVICVLSLTVLYVLTQVTPILRTCSLCAFPLSQTCIQRSVSSCFGHMHSTLSFVQGFDNTSIDGVDLSPTHPSR